jgi:hypothetical protein
MMQQPSNKRIFSLCLALGILGTGIGWSQAVPSTKARRAGNTQSQGNMSISQGHHRDTHWNHRNHRGCQGNQCLHVHDQCLWNPSTWKLDQDGNPAPELKKAQELLKVGKLDEAQIILKQYAASQGMQIQQGRDASLWNCGMASPGDRHHDGHRRTCR